VQLRPLEGIVIDTRPFSTAQLLRLIEESCETLATIRGARFFGEDFNAEQKAGRRR
jgi:hypothetical protein